MKSGPSTGKIVTTALIVTGNMVGAGILALPINLGPAGLAPALGGILATWFLMTCTGIIIARQPFLTENKDADLPTFFEAVLGTSGKWISVAANLIILYGLLTAYLAGVAQVVSTSFNIPLPYWAVLLLYFAVVTLLASFGEAVLRKGNAFLMTLMWVLFGSLLILVVPHMEGINPEAADWLFSFSGLPILVVAFNFHNVVPTLCRSLDHDRRAITKAIWLGSAIGMAMTGVWTIAVMLTLPMEATNGVDIITAFKAGQPATIPLNALIRSPLFVDASILFAVVAMSTSYIATGVATLSFFQDVAGKMVKSRVVVWLLAFLPPVAVGIVYPDIFLQALNIVGGLGVGTLFGLLPGLLLVRQGVSGSRTRLVGYVLLAFFTCVLCMEVAQEFGLLQIRPDIEYWSHEHLGR